MTVFPSFYRGDDYVLEVSVTEDGKPVDIRGWQFVSTLKMSSEMPDQPELTPGGERQVLKVVVTAADTDKSRSGQVQLWFRHGQTAELLPMVYRIDVQRFYRDVVATLADGTVQVLPDVTREAGND